MRKTTHPDERSTAAITAAELAELLGFSTRHVWNLNAAGKLPRPIRLGRTTRWRLREVEAWLAAGCPPRAQWERAQQAEASTPESREVAADA